MLASAVERIAREVPDDARVLDVGGWASPYPRADWVMDLLPHATRGLYANPSAEPERFTAQTWVQRDICDRDPWPFADDFFAFAVCAHTLEDVRDPVGVCRELSRVARAGYVEVPAPQEELRFGVHGPWVGWSHHHWVCETDADGLVFTFKPHLLSAPGRHLPQDSSAPPAVLQLWWTDALPAREQVLVGAEPFDAWLGAILDRFGGPAQPRRRRFGR